MVVAYGLLAFVMAVFAEGVYSLVEEASAFGSAGLFCVILFGMRTERGGRVTACATLITGVVSYVILAYLLPALDVEIAFPYVASLAASALCYAALMNFERPAQTRTEPAAA
jgi:Na+/proline symporter